MKVATSLFLLSVLPLSLLAKEKPRVTVEVVNSQQSVRHWTQHILGTDSRSQTNCDTNGTATDTGGDTASINATTNCSTTTTPGTPARTVEHSIAQEHVYAIMPDGSHVTLWCQNGFRRCESLSAGKYTAEVDGNTLWIYGHELDGKERKIKYHYVGGW